MMMTDSPYRDGKDVVNLKIKHREPFRPFGSATGVPVLLNTSFNLRAEPMVASPAHALDTFMKSDIDVLVMEHCWLTKRRDG